MIGGEAGEHALQLIHLLLGGFDLARDPLHRRSTRNGVDGRLFELVTHGVGLVWRRCWRGCGSGGLSDGLDDLFFHLDPEHLAQSNPGVALLARGFRHFDREVVNLGEEVVVGRLPRLVAVALGHVRGTPISDATRLHGGQGEEHREGGRGNKFLEYFRHLDCSPSQSARTPSASVWAVVRLGAMVLPAGAGPSMSLSYQTAVRLLRVLTRVFFRRVEVSGLDNVPKVGGGILVAWHPNGLVDPGLILTRFPRQVVFGARSGLFRLPVLGWLMHGVGAVPIYRAIDARGAGEIAALRTARASND